MRTRTYSLNGTIYSPISKNKRRSFHLFYVPSEREYQKDRCFFRHVAGHHRILELIVSRVCGSHVINHRQPSYCVFRSVRQLGRTFRTAGSCSLYNHLPEWSSLGNLISNILLNYDCVSRHDSAWSEFSITPIVPSDAEYDATRTSY